MTSSQITETLAQRYCRKDGWISLAELEIGRDAAPPYTARRADFVALSYIRENTCIIAEIKVARADFLNDLKCPEKRKPAFDQSSEAWFVCGPGVCEEPEVPDGWGLMVCDERCHLRTVREAPRRPLAGLQPKFVSRFLERTTTPIPETKRVYLTYDGRQVGAREFQDLVEAEARRVNEKQRAYGYMRQVRTDCYQCQKAVRHQYDRAEIEKRLERALQAIGHPTVLDGCFDFGDLGQGVLL